MVIFHCYVSSPEGTAFVGYWLDWTIHFFGQQVWPIDCLEDMRRVCSCFRNHAHLKGNWCKTANIEIHPHHNSHEGVLWHVGRQTKICSSSNSPTIFDTQVGFFQSPLRAVLESRVQNPTSSRHWAHPRGLALVKTKILELPTSFRCWPSRIAQ